MIQIKHLMDSIEPTDGQRLWVEPIPLTRDFRDWCQVHGDMPTLAPKRHLWEWFQSHPNHYEFFRDMYHAYLQRPAARALAKELALAGTCCNFTLLHTGQAASQNSAAVLLEYLNELQPCCHPGSGSTDSPEWQG